MEKRLLEQDIELNISANAKEHLANEGYEPLYGARPLRRVIRQLIEIPLSLKILEGEFTKGNRITVDYNGEELSFNKE
ncbi:MAG: hypothetical protein ACLSA2_04935 [Candidatus Gastranaerophilaceae bacterium]